MHSQFSLAFTFLLCTFFLTPAHALLIGDRVWEDSNTNGIQDLGEVGISGINVRLLDGIGNELATTTTDSNGLYLFANLTAGTYDIQFFSGVLIGNIYVFTFANQGLDDSLDSDVIDLVTGSVGLFTLSSEDNRTLDAGLCYLSCGTPPTSVPEPGTFALLLLGLAGIGASRLRKLN